MAAGARLFASFGILLNVQWVESPQHLKSTSRIATWCHPKTAGSFGSLATLLLGPCDKVLIPSLSTYSPFGAPRGSLSTWRMCFAPPFAVQRVYNVLTVGSAHVVCVVLRTPAFRMRSTRSYHLSNTPFVPVVKTGLPHLNPPTRLRCIAIASARRSQMNSAPLPSQAVYARPGAQLNKRTPNWPRILSLCQPRFAFILATKSWNGASSIPDWTWPHGSPSSVRSSHSPSIVATLGVASPSQLAARRSSQRRRHHRACAPHCMVATSRT